MENLKRIKKYLLLIGIATSVVACECDDVESKNCLTACSNGIEGFENSDLKHHKISLERSKELYYNYNDSIKPHIRTYQGNRAFRQETMALGGLYNPTEYVLINIKTLKCYLKFLEEVESRNSNEITGIAIFLGANGESERVENIEASFNDKMRKEKKVKANEILRGIQNLPITSEEDIRGRMTMFFAPTYYNNENENLSEVQKHVPFYIKAPDSSKPYVGNYMSLQDKFIEMENIEKSGMQMIVVQSGKDTSLNFNEFTQMPPKKANQ